MQIKFRVKRPAGDMLEFDGSNIHSVEVGAVTMTPATMLQALQIGAMAMQPGGLDAEYRTALYQIAGVAFDHGHSFSHVAEILQLPEFYTREDMRRAAVRDGLDPNVLWNWPEPGPLDHHLEPPDPPPRAA